MKPPRMAAVCALGLAFAATTAHAARPKPTTDQLCQKARYDAAAKYALCHQKAMGLFLAGLGDAPNACRVKYTATWQKLQKHFAGTDTACARDRFAVDSVTVRDDLTGLMWEKHTDDNGIRDQDNYYAMTASGSGSAFTNGTVFTDFLAQLNTPPCFATFCDWRVPTLAELLTIEAPTPCDAPCIDENVFGPTAGLCYWTATTLIHIPRMNWVVGFTGGEIGANELYSSCHVRAVRGGL